MSATARTNGASSRPAAWPRADVMAVNLAVAALSTTLMLEAMRVLVSYLIVVVGQANRSALVRDTLAVFVAIAVAPLLIRLVGLRISTAGTASSIAIVRIVLQFWTQPNARLVMAAAIIILWGWLIVALLGTGRRPVAFGLMTGLVLDIAVRVAFLTLDLPWNTGFAAGGVTVALATLLLGAAILILTTKDEHRSSRGFSLSLIAVGPGLATFHLVSGNLGLAQIRTGLGFSAAMAVLAVGLTAGVAGSVLLERECKRRPRWLHLIERLVLIVIGGVALWLFWSDDTIAPFALPFVVTANLTLLGAAVWSDGEPAARERPIAPAIWLTLGLLLQVGILFYYYDESGRPRYIALAATLLAAGALFGATPTVPSDRPPMSSRQTTALLVSPLLLLALICGWQFVGVSHPATGPALAGSFTVMTYNLQDGFAADNSFDLEAQAATIAAAHPDVVVLQEVSRGWLVTSGGDEAFWLSRRLNMPIYFGGNSDDGLWGNAILTRAPVASVTRHRFTVTRNLSRGTIEARVPTANGDFWVVGTHLDNPKAAGAIRVEQARQLIATLGDRFPAVVMGDFNADPGTDVLNTFADAGLIDPGTTYLAGISTTTDGRRLDYVLVSGGLRVDAMQAIDSPASDHKPVVARLTRIPR